MIFNRWVESMKFKWVGCNYLHLDRVSANMPGGEEALY